MVDGDRVMDEACHSPFLQMRRKPVPFIAEDHIQVIHMAVPFEGRRHYPDTRVAYSEGI